MLEKVEDLMEPGQISPKALKSHLNIPSYQFEIMHLKNIITERERTISVLRKENEGLRNQLKKFQSKL